MTAITHTQTILKCRVTNNQKLVTVVAKYPEIPDEVAYVGQSFTSSKVKADIGTIVYLNVRIHGSRTHTINWQAEGEPGRLQDTFEQQFLEQGGAAVAPATARDSLTEIFGERPKISDQPHFYVDPANAEIFGTAARSLHANPNRAFKILMAGKSGYGKTSIAQRFALKTGMDCIRMNCASVRDPEEWFGYRIAEDGSTKFMPSNFIQKVTEGNCVVILDEFNRLEPWLTNTIYPMLDHDQQTEIYNETYTVGPNVLWVATVNIGFQFAGTFQIDEALSNRFDFVAHVGDIPSTEEIKVLQTAEGIDGTAALQIVKIASKIRRSDNLPVPCSIRTTLQIANAVAAGMNLRSAFQHTLISSAQLTNNDKLHKSLIDFINGELGVYSPQDSLVFDFS